MFITDGVNTLLNIRMLNKNKSVLIIVFSLTSVINLVVTDPLIFKLLIGIIAVAGIFIANQSPGRLAAILIGFSLVIILTIPKLNVSYFFGYELKFFYAATIITQEMGFSLADFPGPSTAPYPGLQITTSLVLIIVGTGAREISLLLSVLFPIINIVLLLGIARFQGMEDRGISLLLITLACSTELLIMNDFHYIMLGILLYASLLLFLSGYFQLTQSSEEFLIGVLVISLSLVISHPYSSILSGFTIFSLFIYYIFKFRGASGNTIQPAIKSISVMLFLGIGLITYTLWIASDWFGFALSSISFGLFGSSTSQLPPDRVLNEFTPLYNKPIFDVVLGSLDILNILLLGICILVLILSYAMFDTDQGTIARLYLYTPPKTNFIIVVISSLFLWTIFDQIAFIKSLPRMVKYSFPLLLLTLIIVYENVPQNYGVKTLFYIAIILTLVFNAAAYPSYLLDDSNQYHDSSPQWAIDNREESTLKWASVYSDNIVGGRMARQYMTGLQKGIAVNESVVAYLSCSGQSGSLLLYRTDYERILFTSWTNYHIALPSNYYRVLNRDQCRAKVYSNGAERYYFSN